MQFEKYIPKRIVRDISPEAIERDGNRAFLPGDCIDIYNCRFYTSEDGTQYIVESIRGNTIKSFGLFTGTNRCIGHFPYTKANSIVFFIYNSLGAHRVIEWNFDTQAFTVLLSGYSLNFSLDHYITQGGILDDICLFNDAYNRVRHFNIARAKTGFYLPPYPEFILSLETQPPGIAPTFAFRTDSTNEFNYLSGDTWQFAFRIVLLDGEVSVFSPLSLLAYAGEITNVTDNTNNTIDVTVLINALFLPYIRTVEIAARAGNIGDYFVFKQVQYPTSGTIVASFTNGDIAFPVAKDDEIRLNDRIPPVAKAFGLIKNRAFVSLNDIGFDVPETFSLAITIGKENYVANKRYLKMGGAYNAGIVFDDGWGNYSFVKAKQSISVPYYYGAAGVPDTNKQFLNWSIGGTPPPGVTGYRVVLSKNEFQGIYAQCMAVPYLYISEILVGDGDGEQNDTVFNWRGRRFCKIEKGTLNSVGRPAYKYVYLQIPLNLALIADNSYYVKIMHADFTYRSVPVIAIVDDFIVVDLKYFGTPPTDPTDTTGLIDWQNYIPVFLEIFRVLENPDERFFEVGPRMDIVSGAFSVGSGKLYGDTYTMKQISGRYRFQYTPIILKDSGYVPVQFSTTNFGPQISAVESPSGLYSSSFISVDYATFVTKYRLNQKGANALIVDLSLLSTLNPVSTLNALFPIRKGGALIGPGGALGPVQIEGNSAQVFTPGSGAQQVFGLDYNKVASDFGRVFIINNNEKKTDQNTDIGYSDPFFQNTLIFGLNTFRAENKYSIPRDRSAITSLKKAGNVLVALHERNCSTLYIGEGLIRQQDLNNQFILAKSTDVVGDNRELEYGYGCINPESIIEVHGELYFWDAYRGAVVHNTKAGNFPVSNYGNRSYFYAKARAYEPYRNSVKIVMGYDYFNEELLITFPAVDNTPIIAETWAFSPDHKAWCNRYAYIPDWYAALNNNLMTFKDGQLWLHHSNSLFNNFYGVQYKRWFEVVCNPALGKNKRFLNIHIRGDIAQDMDSEFQVVKLTTSEGQISFIPAYEFSKDEGKWVAPVLKDTQTPNIPDDQLALRSGDDMVGNYMIVHVENDRTDQGKCSQVNVVFKTEEFSI